MTPVLKRLMVCGLCAVAVTSSGCRVFKVSCEAPPTAEEVATIPPLKTPEGVTAPDTRNALRIPEVSEPAKVRSKSDPCLEAPPTYSPGWQPDQKAQEVKPGDPGTESAEPKKKRRWWWPWGK